MGFRFQLHNFLPSAIPAARILTYSYQSSSVRLHWQFTDDGAGDKTAVARRHLGPAVTLHMSTIVALKDTFQDDSLTRTDFCAESQAMGSRGWTSFACL